MSEPPNPEPPNPEPPNPRTLRPGVSRPAASKLEAPRRGLGDNGGPPLEPDDPDASWRLFCWRKAHRLAWKTPPREIALRRLQRAEELGITYRAYTLEILERGKYL